MDFKGTQIAIDMYSCDEEVLTNHDVVKALVQNAVSSYHMEEQAIYYVNDNSNDEYSYLIPCKRGHMNLHVYPSLGFIAMDIFTLQDGANPEKLAISLRKAFNPDKSKITFLERGDFGSESDMKPRRKKQIKTIRRAKNAGTVLKQLLFKPKSI